MTRVYADAADQRGRRSLAGRAADEAAVARRGHEPSRRPEPRLRWDVSGRDHHSEPAHTGPMPALRYLDVLVVLVVGVAVLAVGVPVFGYLVGGGAWIVSRVLQANRHRWVSKIAKSDGMRRAAVSVFEAFGRISLLSIAIIVAGVAGRRTDGLTAAVVIFGAYSIAFVLRLMSGPPAGTPR
jgi:hypothetical protein